MHTLEPRMESSTKQLTSAEPFREEEKLESTKGATKIVSMKLEKIQETQDQ